MPTNKNSEGEVWFESLREEGALLWLIYDPNCVKVDAQSIPIPNINKSKRDYYPDIYAEFEDGEKYIFDVKEKKYLDDLEINIEEAQRWEDRKKCMGEYCEKHGIK